MILDALTLAALRTQPALCRQVEPALAAAEQTLAAWGALPAPDAALLATVRAAAAHGQVLELRGTDLAVAVLFVRLAAEERWPVWLDGGTAGQRLVCAQLIAAYGLHPALVPPQAGPDPAPLEALLAAAATQGPLALLVWDLGMVTDPVRPALPRALPAGVVLICRASDAAPLTPLRISGVDLPQLALPAAAPAPVTLPLPALPALPLTRRWVLAQERRTGSHAEAAAVAAQALVQLRQTAEPGALVHAALLAATLQTLARGLPPDATAAAFVAAVDAGEPRELALRAVRALVDQLPDSQQKAAVLRRLGEACHERGQRGAAMRLLASALDLEGAETPRAWRAAREEAQAALARAALAADAPEIALSVTVKINHAERRGFIETDVVRHYIRAGKLKRAEEVALAIGHESMHEWAMAEVGVAHAARGNRARAETVIGTLRTASAAGWALATIVSADARRGLAGVNARVAAITEPRLRDQAHAAVAAGRLASADCDGALVACAQIADGETRVRTLLELAGQRASAAPPLLDRAEAELGLLDDHRLPLAVALASARAGLGDLAGVTRAAALLPTGEEQDRAISRAAVALSRTGDTLGAQRLAASVPDADERDRAYREIIVALSETTLLALGARVAAQIVDPLERARALADASLTLAQRGAAQAALRLLGWIMDPPERARAALTLFGPLLAHGEFQRAAELVAQDHSAPGWDRRSAALVAAIAAHAAAPLCANDAERLKLMMVGDLLPFAAERAAQIGGPQLRARALVALARAGAARDPAQARAWLGAALQEAAALGRAETLALVVQSADVLVRLSGPEVLLSAAHALDEIDGWLFT